jgi:GH25 family lysozyme M1 (1,4-beta-N-acetylmuramidase)
MNTVYLPLVMNEFVEKEEQQPMKPIVDISFWQSPDSIDYDKFAAAISGVILRGAYGIWKDTKFEKHYEEFHKRGVPIGCYHYIIGNYSGKQQADLFYSIVKDKELKLWLWNDVEDRGVITGLSSKVVIEYHSNIESLTGKKVGIYTGVYAWSEIMGANSKMYADRDLWLAHYGVVTPSLPRYSGWTKWVFWQYSSSGRIDGYYGNIDMNNFNGEQDEFVRKFSLGIVTPEPPSLEGKFYCNYCGTYTENDSYGCCAKCGAPREDWIPEPQVTTLHTTRIVNIRSQPSTTASTVGVRTVGEEVRVKNIFVLSSSSVWVEDHKGWSAVVHAGIKYME